MCENVSLSVGVGGVCVCVCGESGRDGFSVLPCNLIKKIKFEVLKVQCRKYPP